MNIGKINQLTNTLADELNKNGVEVTTPHRLIKERDMLRSEVKRLREGLETAEYRIRLVANSLGEMLPSMRGKLHAIAGGITEILEPDNKREFDDGQENDSQYF